MKFCGIRPRWRTTTPRKSWTATGSRSRNQRRVMELAGWRLCGRSPRPPRFWFYSVSPVVKECETLPTSRSSLHDRQHIAGIHGDALSGEHFLDGPLLRRFDFVLHLHRLHHQHARARLHCIAFPHQYAHHFAGHGRRQLSRTVIIRGAGATMQRARIAHLAGESRAAHPQVPVIILVPGNALRLDLVSLVADTEGKHVRPNQHRINRDFVAVQTARPPALGSLDFEPVILAVDGDVVKHKNGASDKTPGS